MPLYEYRCADCGTEFERLRSQSVADDSGNCPTCGQSHARRLMSVVATIGRSSSAESGMGMSLPMASGGGCGCGGACSCH